ncbi:MAG: BBP7 family outer membrane beta-barrel protein [Gammaproteobacteria bacterium]
MNSLERDSDDSVTYVYDQGGPPVSDKTNDIPLGSTGSFDDDADTGYLVSGSFEITDKWSINAAIMESEMSSSDSFTDPNSRLDVFRYIGTTPWTESFDAADRVEASYDSELSGVDLNAVYRFSDSVDFMVGVGQMDMDEKFKIYSVDSASAIRPDGGTYEIRTENDMFGPHLGVAWNGMFSEKWGGYVVGKVGWYENDSEQRQRVDDNDTRVNGESDSGTSMVTDIRLGLNYHFSIQVAVNAGYQLIQISDVALAESQFYDSVPPGSNDIDSSGEIDWDGFNLGLKISF